VLVLGLALIAGFGLLGRGQPATTSPEERRPGRAVRREAVHPGLVLPLLVVIGVFVLKPLTSAARRCSIPSRRP
jgi:uncharacterized membrane protein